MATWIVVVACCVVAFVIIVKVMSARFKRQATDSLVSRCREYALEWQPQFEADYPQLNQYENRDRWELLVTTACVYMGYQRVVQGLSRAQDAEYLAVLTETLRSWKPASIGALSDLQRFLAQAEEPAESAIIVALWVVAHLKGVEGTVTEASMDPEDERLGSHLAGTLATSDQDFAATLASTRLD